VCEYEGKGYTLNEKFKAKDGCNTCSCQIDGDVVCTEEDCASASTCDEKYGCTDAGVATCDPKYGCSDGANDPVMGCDPKYGCADASVMDPGTCDPKYGCGDANAPWCDPKSKYGCGLVNGYCDYFGKLFKPGETFKIDDCNTCSCEMVGLVCSDKVCYEPDAAVAPGACVYAGAVYKLGEYFSASDHCNKCSCTDKGVVECTQVACNGGPSVGDAGANSCAPFSCPAGKGSCSYQGKTYNVGDGFERGDNCNKCLCVSDGAIECTAASCAPTPGCTIGLTTQLRYEQSVTCADGCNTCTCKPQGIVQTERACPALPPVTKCDSAMTQLAFPAHLAYQAGDAIAVTDSRCVNGQVNDFALCYDSLVSTMGQEAALYVVPTGTKRACDGTERVYSLTALRDDYISTFMQRVGKIVLRGDGDGFVYQFGI
jgi:hypothetical protein